MMFIILGDISTTPKYATQYAAYNETEDVMLW